MDIKSAVAMKYSSHDGRTFSSDVTRATTLRRLSEASIGRMLEMGFQKAISKTRRQQLRSARVTCLRAILSFVPNLAMTTTAVWKTRPARLWAFVGFATVVCAVIALFWWRRVPDAATPRAVFLVADHGEVFVRVGLRTHRVSTTEAVGPGKTIALPTGKTLRLIYPDGRSENVTGPKRITTVSGTSDDPTLTSPLRELLKKSAFPSLPNSTAITSPVGATRFLRPALTWEGPEKLTFDVAIGDPADPNAPARIARAAKAPVAFSTLESTLGPELVPDRLMAALIRGTTDQNLRAISRFLVTPNAVDQDLPTDPAALIAESFSALTTKPARVGDSFLALEKLPPEWKRSELAVRLRIMTATQAGASRALETAMADARTLAKR